MRFGADDLVRLMTLASHQHHVTGNCCLQCLHDGQTPVRHHVHCCCADSGPDVGEDLRRIFGARVVVGEHDAVGSACSHSTHQRSLAAIPIATTAEHRGQATGAVPSQY